MQKRIQRRRQGGDGYGDGGEVMETESIDLSHWQEVMELIQVAFREVQMAEKYMQQVAVLIPKGGGDYRGIGLV